MSRKPKPPDISLKSYRLIEALKEAAYACGEWRWRIDDVATVYEQLLRARDKAELDLKKHLATLEKD